MEFLGFKLGMFVLGDIGEGANNVIKAAGDKRIHGHAGRQYIHDMWLSSVHHTMVHVSQEDQRG